MQALKLQLLAVRFLPFLALLFVLASPNSVEAVPTYVQGTMCHHDGAGNAICTLNGVAATHTIHVLLFSCGPSPGFSTSLSLSYSLDLTKNTTPDGCNFRQASLTLYRAPVGASSGTETINATLDGAVVLNIYIIMEEWSGESQTGGAGAIDGSNSAAGLSLGTISSGTFTTSTSGDLLVAGAYCLSQNCGLTAGTGFTIHNSQGVVDLTGFGAGFMALETKVTGAAGSYSGDFTLSANTDWIVLAAAYSATTPTIVRHHAVIIKYRKTPVYKIPWDRGRRWTPNLNTST
jgi:hypothetical protein